MDKKTACFSKEFAALMLPRAVFSPTGMSDEPLFPPGDPYIIGSRPDRGSNLFSIWETVMGVSVNDAEADLADMIEMVRGLFYGAGDWKCDGKEIKPKIVVDRTDNAVNANGCPVGVDGWGIKVSGLALEFLDRNSLRFALAHELGHFFKADLLDKWGIRTDLQQASDQQLTHPPEIGPYPTYYCAPELAADLGGAYVINCAFGSSWDETVRVAANWQTSGIFDNKWSGQHPPGGDRARFVNDLKNKIAAEGDFEKAGKAIIEREKSFLPPVLFTIQVEPTPLTVAAGGTVKVTVKVTRGTYQGKISFRFGSLPSGVSGPTVKPALQMGQNSLETELAAKDTAAVKTTPDVVVWGETTRVPPDYEKSRPFALTVGPKVA